MVNVSDIKSWLDEKHVCKPIVFLTITKIHVQMADRNHKKEYYDAICDLESCFDDDSDESTILKMLSFQRASDSFRAHFETDNLCKNDVPLSLTRITASEDYQLVWLHDGQPLKAHIREDAEEKLRIVFVNIHCFTSMDLCLHFLRELDADCVRLVFISSCFYDGRVSPLSKVPTFQSLN